MQKRSSPTGSRTPSLCEPHWWSQLLQDFELDQWDRSCSQTHHSIEAETGEQYSFDEKVVTMARAGRTAGSTGYVRWTSGSCPTSNIFALPPDLMRSASSQMIIYIWVASNMAKETEAEVWLPIGQDILEK